MLLRLSPNDARLESELRENDERLEHALVEARRICEQNLWRAGSGPIPFFSLIDKGRVVKVVAQSHLPPEDFIKFELGSANAYAPNIEYTHF